MTAAFVPSVGATRGALSAASSLWSESRTHSFAVSAGTQRRQRVAVVRAAAEKTEKETAAESPAAAADTAIAPLSEVPFELRGFSLGNVGVAIGGLLTVYSFFTYFQSSGTASATSLGFVYGIPVLLIGLALKYAELKPVPLISTTDSRETKASEIQKKIIADVTRHRYGDEQHLDTSLKLLGLVVRGGGEYPEMLRLIEGEVDGQYSLAMVFYSKDTPYKDWEAAREPAEKFFGPNLRCEVRKVDEENRIVEMKLITTNN